MKLPWKLYVKLDSLLWEFEIELGIANISKYSGLYRYWEKLQAELDKIAIENKFKEIKHGKYFKF